VSETRYCCGNRLNCCDDYYDDDDDDYDDDDYDDDDSHVCPEQPTVVMNRQHQKLVSVKKHSAGLGHLL